MKFCMFQNINEMKGVGWGGIEVVSSPLTYWLPFPNCPKLS